MKSALTLGQKVKDRITGFEGTVTVISFHLNGCVQVCVAPNRLDDKGGLIESGWFDEQRLTDTPVAETGGPGPTPPGWKC